MCFAHGLIPVNERLGRDTNSIVFSGDHEAPEKGVREDVKAHKARALQDPRYPHVQVHVFLVELVFEYVILRHGNMQIVFRLLS